MLQINKSHARCVGEERVEGGRWNRRLEVADNKWRRRTTTTTTATANELANSHTQANARQNEAKPSRNRQQQQQQQRRRSRAAAASNGSKARGRATHTFNLIAINYGKKIKKSKQAQNVQKHEWIRRMREAKRNAIYTDGQTGRQIDRETVTHAAQYKQTNKHTQTHAHSQPGRQRQQRQRQQQSLKEPRKTCKLRVIEQIKVKQRQRQREMERGRLAGSKGGRQAGNDDAKMSIENRIDWRTIKNVSITITTTTTAAATARTHSQRLNRQL